MTLLTQIPGISFLYAVWHSVHVRSLLVSLAYLCLCDICRRDFTLERH